MNDFVRVCLFAIDTVWLLLLLTENTVTGNRQAVPYEVRAGARPRARAEAVPRARRRPPDPGTGEGRVRPAEV